MEHSRKSYTEAASVSGQVYWYLVTAKRSRSAKKSRENRTSSASRSVGPIEGLSNLSITLVLIIQRCRRCIYSSVNFLLHLSSCLSSPRYTVRSVKSSMSLTDSLQNLSNHKGSGAGSQKADTKGNPASMATIHNDDERLLARIGYKQVS